MEIETEEKPTLLPEKEKRAIQQQETPQEEQPESEIGPIEMPVAPECQPSTEQIPTKKDLIFLGNSNYAWPIPGYTTLSSKFGKRIAPTTGASTFHKGIDIPAPEGTNLIATCDGIITFTGFLGGGGYTITLTNYDGIKISYCHVSPIYIVYVDELIKQGQIIGNVGPKYVYGVSGNTYSDPATGKPTNGATTGCHLHIGFRIENNYVNPLDYLQ